MEARAPRSQLQAEQAADTSLLDDTFRIDIRTISVTFDYYPDQSVVDAAARVEFVMRPGQTVPRFHFRPGVSPPPIRSLVLDGEAIPVPGAALTSVRITGSSQPILQLDRTLAADRLHVLELGYRLTLPAAYPRFSTEVNDLAGHGNEELFPTVNAPHELARHLLAFRVHGDREFRCIGSGRVERHDDIADASVQQWRLDTEREVASYTVMFVLLPAADTDLQVRIIHGIPVSILAFTGGASIAQAFATLEDWLPRLQARFGDYPAPRGLSVFLVSSGGGMEYFGGTISSPSALTHEVLHGYFACAVVTKSYRDSWMDEAITQWFDSVSHGRTYAVMDESYRGNWVGARSPVSVGFSSLAYEDGSRIMQYLANRLGGVDRMASFLRRLYEQYAFKPFTTMDFVSYFRDFSGIDVQPQFQNWLYRGVAQEASR